jgi:hypothetical protein
MMTVAVSSGVCMNDNSQDFRVLSIDGSSYLTDTLNHMLQNDIAGVPPRVKGGISI